MLFNLGEVLVISIITEFLVFFSFFVNYVSKMYCCSSLLNSFIGEINFLHLIVSKAISDKIKQIELKETFWRYFFLSILVIYFSFFKKYLRYIIFQIKLYLYIRIFALPKLLRRNNQDNKTFKSDINEKVKDVFKI